MELYSGEWNIARKQLHEPLTKYLEHSDMGSFTYFLDPRGISIKHRMRTDHVATISLGCWSKANPDAVSKPLWFKTIAFPADPATVGKALETYLVDGVMPDFTSFVTFLGYEEFDQWALTR